MVRSAGETIVITLAGKPAAGHPRRQLSRDLARRTSGRWRDGIFDRRRNDNGGNVGADKKPDRSNALIWLARIGLYLGLFAGVGGGVFWCLDRAPRERAR